MRQLRSLNFWNTGLGRRTARAQPIQQLSRAALGRVGTAPDPAVMDRRAGAIGSSVGLALELDPVVLRRAGGAERRRPALSVLGLDLSGHRQGQEGQRERLDVAALGLEL